MKTIGLLSFASLVSPTHLRDSHLFFDNHVQADSVSYYSNDAVSNYLYGEKGIENYFNSITKARVATKCPVGKPFTADGKVCFQCTV